MHGVSTDGQSVDAQVKQLRAAGAAKVYRETASGRLMLIVLGGLAEFERELIRARTHEGRARQGERRQARTHAEAYPSSAARSDL